MDDHSNPRVPYTILESDIGAPPSLREGIYVGAKTRTALLASRDFVVSVDLILETSPTRMCGADHRPLDKISNSSLSCRSRLRQSYIRETDPVKRSPHPFRCQFHHEREPEWEPLY